jgi:hypothetical protein
MERPASPKTVPTVKKKVKIDLGQVGETNDLELEYIEALVARLAEEEYPGPAVIGTAPQGGPMASDSLMGLALTRRLGEEPWAIGRCCRLRF